MTAINYDFEQEQGATFAVLLTLKNENGEIININGFSFRGQIREKISADTVIAEFSFDIVAPASGQVIVSLTAEQTALLPASGSKYSMLTKLFYDIEMVYPSGAVERIMNGYFKVSPRVTR